VDCDGLGHPGLPCSGTRGCKVKSWIARRENELFPERRRALLNHARTWALRTHPLVPSTHNQNRVVGLRDHSVSR